MGWKQAEIDCYTIKTTGLGCKDCNIDIKSGCNMFNLVLAKYRLLGKPPLKEEKQWHNLNTK